MLRQKKTTMIIQGERYINPLTDFGFKRIFGSPFNSDLLISFLNALLDGERVIKEVKYNNTEKFGSNEWARKVIFDVYCTTESGGRFIIEMQNLYQDFFKDRSIYYSTFPISEQAKRGDWNYELHDVYTIGILNFAFPEDKKADDDGIYREVKLMDTRTKKVFYDKLTYIYVELENFKKTLEECTTILDKWLFCLKNMQNLMERPTELQGRIFERLFKTAEIAKFNTNERREYEVSMNSYREIKNSMDSAEKAGIRKGIKKGRKEGREEGLKEGRQKGLKEGRQEGLKEGRQEGLQEVAQKMKSEGFPLETISKLTGLTKKEIEEI